MKYFLLSAGSKVGPLSRDEVQTMLANGTASTTDSLWSATQDDWVRIDQHADFNGAPAAPADTQEDNLTALYEAYIGPRKASYYLPIFDRFDRGGSMFSWNWPAALLTQWWMLYRGMFLWGLLWYTILSYAGTLLLIAIGGAIGEGAIMVAYALSIILAIAATGVFGNKLLHRHVRKLIDKSARLGLSPAQRRDWMLRKGSNNGVFIVLMILAVIFIVGILAAIALPVYQDYTVRARVAASIAGVADVRRSYGEYVTEHEQWPESMAALGISETDFGAGVASVTIGEQNEIRVTYAEPVIGGAVLIMEPAVENGALTWYCRVGTLPKKYAPEDCRR